METPQPTTEDAVLSQPI